MSDFEKMKMSCRSRHFDECLNKEHSGTQEKKFCGENECPLTGLGTKRMKQLTYNLEAFCLDQLRMIQVIHQMKHPASETAARIWEDQVAKAIEIALQNATR